MEFIRFPKCVGLLAIGVERYYVPKIWLWTNALATGLSNFHLYNIIVYNLHFLFFFLFPTEFREPNGADCSSLGYLYTSGFQLLVVNLTLLFGSNRGLLLWQPNVNCLMEMEESGAKWAVYSLDLGVVG